MHNSHSTITCFKGINGAIINEGIMEYKGAVSVISRDPPFKNMAMHD